MLSGFTRLPSKSKTWSQCKRSSVSRRLLNVLMLSGSFSYQLFENYFACRLCCFRATRLHAARQGVRQKALEAQATSRTPGKKSACAAQTGRSRSCGMQSQSATLRKDPPAPHRPPAVHRSFSFPKKSTKSSSSGQPLAPSSAHSSAPLPQEVQPTSKSGESAK